MDTRIIVSMMPIQHKLGHFISIIKPKDDFKSSSYWENRYSTSGNSGSGSYGKQAIFKAETINDFVIKENIDNVIEFGCGDGNQLLYLKFPNYLGFDVSQTAIDRCINTFRNDDSKNFLLLNEQCPIRTAQLTMSIDVIFHLIEDDVFHRHMTALFDCSEKFVIIFSSNFISKSLLTPQHVRHRIFTSWVEKNKPEWHLYKKINNPYNFFSDFYFFKKGTN